MNNVINYLMDELKKVCEVYNRCETQSKWFVTDANLFYICHYEPSEGATVMRDNHFQSIPYIRLEPKTKCYSGEGISYLKGNLYASPILINQKPEFYIVCTHTPFNDPLMLQLLEVKSNFISSRLEERFRMNRVFLQNRPMKEITETVDMGCLSIDRYGTIAFINEVGSEILGVKTDAIVGKPLADVVDVSVFSLSVLETGEPMMKKQVKMKINKGQFFFILSATPLFDNLNEPVGVIYHFKDIRKDVEIVEPGKSFFHFDDIVYECKQMDLLVEVEKKAARTDSNILIEGESGTGKELIAQSIHNFSERAKKPFIVIDCSAIPRNLVESELFGYAEGAFTGSRKGGRMGKFERANGGTVFLDEIGELPLEIQSKLLRVLQSRTVTRIGSHESIPVDIRIIAATNRNLAGEVLQGNFRQDLYYRLNVMNLTVPSLRERLDDLPVLVNHLLTKTSKREKRERPQISSEVIEAFTHYSWPGNIRELENTIERAVILAFDEIHLEHLPERLLAHKKFARKENDELAFSMKTKKMMEQQLIIKTLDELNGNKTKAARKLGISRSTLYDKLYQYNLL
ncbi:sigma-54 interaction domain-containing protein [Neobacillus sp. Marseille-QA0830]